MKKTVLIVDDDTMSRGLIRMVLEYDAFNCLEAADGEMALAVLESHPIDLMILDLIMPKVTGMEVLRVLQQSGHTLQPKIIIVSGMLNPDIRKRADQMGVQAILEKPYDMGQLRTLVSNLCAAQSTQARNHSFSRP